MFIEKKRKARKIHIKNNTRKDGLRVTERSETPVISCIHPVKAQKSGVLELQNM